MYIFLFYPAIDNKSPLRQSCKVNHFSFKWFPFPLFLYVQLQQRNREVCVCMRVVNSDWCWETGRETWSPPKGWATVVVFVVGGGGLLFVRLFPTLSLTFLNYVSLHACWPWYDLKYIEFSFLFACSNLYLVQVVLFQLLSFHCAWKYWKLHTVILQATKEGLHKSQGGKVPFPVIFKGIL